jgi:trans-aconitate methyltransferase
MSYFDDKKNVQDYIKMAEGYDGAELITVLKEFLPPGSSVLELGMGPGVDLDILKQDFIVTGTDYSQVFVDLYKEKYPDADVLQLDALTIALDRSFDCIYSNKVLHHLQRNELEKSFARQKEILESGGFLFHSFWAGEGEEEMHGLLFTYYDEAELTTLLQNDFEILRMARYEEMEKNDSIYVLARKK